MTTENVTTRSVFVSYSRDDREIVAIAARLLKAGGVSVFQDVLDIEYGERWQQVLDTALSKCERVLVFWSSSAATSKWVRIEYKTAIQLDKRVVPMLLDATPLPVELASLNGMPDLIDVLHALRASAGRRYEPRFANEQLHRFARAVDRSAVDELLRRSNNLTKRMKQDLQHNSLPNDVVSLLAARQLHAWLTSKEKREVTQLAEIEALIEQALLAHEHEQQELVHSVAGLAEEMRQFAHVVQVEQSDALLATESAIAKVFVGRLFGYEASLTLKPTGKGSALSNDA